MFRSARSRACLLAIVAFLAVPAVNHAAAPPPPSVRLPVRPPVDACPCPPVKAGPPRLMDGQYQQAVEGAYVLVNENTCEYHYTPDTCTTAPANRWCAPNVAIKHYNVAYGDPGEFCAGGPVNFDTGSGFTYHKRTLMQ